MVKKDRGTAVEIIAIIVLFIGVALLVAFCFPNGAKAAELQPSPSPLPEVIDRGLAVNIIGVVGVAAFFGVLLILALRNMRKHEDS